jgi:hypothetical protein
MGIKKDKYMIKHNNIKYFTDYKEFCDYPKDLDYLWGFDIEEIFNENGFLILEPGKNGDVWCSCFKPNVGQNNKSKALENCRSCKVVYDILIREKKLKKILDK